MKKILISLCVAVCATLSHAGWPEKPIKLIIPYSPGGTTDILVKTMQPKLNELLQQPIVVEYAAGASSMIGASKAAQATDNHTFLVTADEFLTNSIVDPTGLHSAKNFRTVAFLAHSPIMIGTRTGSPHTNAKEVLSNDTLSFGNAGKFSISNLILRQTNRNWISASYKGGAPMFMDVFSGNLDLSSCSVLQATGHIRSGKLVPVMVYSRTRVPTYPNTPTSFEMGVPLSASVWIGVVAPTLTTDEATSKLSAAVLTVLKDKELMQKLVDSGLTIEPKNHKEFDRFLKDSTAQIKSLL
jgi:tripartite-type tricarboxylate transporter receptor subunit TctC